MGTWIVTLVGLSTVFWIGTQELSLSVSVTLGCIVASNVAGFFALLSILSLERVPAIKRRLLFRPALTWIAFLMLFLGPLLLFAPVLRIPRVLAWLIVPLAMGNGLGVMAFGPVQDWLVARAQRRARLAAYQGRVQT